MKVAQITKPGADFEIVDREIPVPGSGQVRIKVQACGVCHSDVFTKEGQWPGIQYPRVPGHEVVGIVDDVGVGVTGWNKGQRVGVGWHGGHDGTCLECRRGDFRNCRNRKVPGISYDGGYQQYMVAPVEALAAMPDSLGDAEAAPLLCAGITTFGALRSCGARPGDLVAVIGVGGLGHLAIQFANKFGYKVAAIARGSANATLAKKLGAAHYIDSTSSNYERSENFASPNAAVLNQRRVYVAPGRLGLNQWSLAGEWAMGTPATVLSKASGQIAFRFHARDVHLVMGPPRPESQVRFRVTIDGQPPGAAHGIDVDESGNGTAVDQRLYQLIRQSAPIVDRTFAIEFLDAGVETFSFTFG